MAGANALEDADGKPRPGAAGRGAPSRPASSRATATTSRCRGPRRSGSSTGRSKRPSCSGCRPSASSAAGSRVVVGGGSGIGREVALQLAKRGAHVVVADLNAASAEAVASEAAARCRLAELVLGVRPRPRRRARASPRRSAPRSMRFGGVDIVINTAAIYPDAGAGHAARADLWALTLQHQRHQQPRAGRGSGEGPEGAEPARRDRAHELGERGRAEGAAARPYDVSKAAINHLIRELAIGLGPLVRVNGIAPATVIAGSSMFPRDRVIVVAEEVQHRVRRVGDRPRRCATSWRSSTRAAPSRAGRSCRSTAPTRSAAWPATRAPRPPATSSRSTAGCRRRSCGERRSSSATPDSQAPKIQRHRFARF